MFFKHLTQNLNQSKRHDECVDTASDDVLCDFMLAVACTRHGYWLGNIIADNAIKFT